MVTTTILYHTSEFLFSEHQNVRLKKHTVLNNNKILSVHVGKIFISKIIEFNIKQQVHLEFL